MKEKNFQLFDPYISQIFVIILFALSPKNLLIDVI